MDDHERPAVARLHRQRRLHAVERADRRRRVQLSERSSRGRLEGIHHALPLSARVNSVSSSEISKSVSAGCVGQLVAEAEAVVEHADSDA